MSERKSERLDSVTKFFISVIGIVVIFIVLKELQTIFIPFVIAYFLFFVFKPLNDFLVKKKIPEFLAIIIDLGIIILFLWGIVNVVMVSFGRLAEQLPVYERKLNQIVYDLGAAFELQEFKDFSISQLIAEIDYAGLAGGFFSTTLNFLGTSFFILFFFVFIVSGHRHIFSAIQRYIISAGKNPEIENDEQKFNLELTFNSITEQIQRYVITKFLLSLLTGALIAVILWIFDIDFMLVWATITFLFNFIPNIGSAIAVLLPALMTLIQYESFSYMLLVTSLMIGVQSTVGNLLEPKIFGTRLGLNPLVILLALLLWGYIWGIIGMFLSVPLTAIFKIIISNSKSKKLLFISDLIDNN